MQSGKGLPTLDAKYIVGDEAPELLEGASVKATFDAASKKASLKTEMKHEAELAGYDADLVYKLESVVKDGASKGGLAMAADLDVEPSVRLAAALGTISGDKEDACDGGARLAASVAPYDPLNLKLTASMIANTEGSLYTKLSAESSVEVPDVLGGIQLVAMASIVGMGKAKVDKFKVEKTWKF